jgi:hypothetical protein
MKKLGKLLLLVIGMTSFVTMAQKADSVIVIYKNQKTVIPVPAYKSQSSISYSDSIQVIEIGVLQRQPGDISPFPQYPFSDLNTGKTRRKEKWFSEVEAGYIKGFTQTDAVSVFYTNDDGVPHTWTQSFSVKDLKGFQIRLSLYEKEYAINNKYSFNSSFKFGFAQSYFKAEGTLSDSDSIGNILFTNNYNYQNQVTSYQFIYQLGISYHFTLMVMPARINIGNCLGFSATKIYGTPALISDYTKYPVTLLQPYLGMEIGKIGAMFSADLNFPHNHSTELFKYVGRSIGLSLTYRIF